MSSKSRILKRALLTCSVMLCLLTNDLAAQSWPLVGGAGAWNWGSAAGLSITPVARAGYERYGFNFNLPVGDEALDLSLTRAGLPMGSVGLLIAYGDRFGLFANAEGTLPRTVSVLTAEEPFHDGPFSKITWTGSKFQVGSLEAGLVYRLSTDQPFGVSLVGGVRWSKLSSSLDGPEVGSEGQGSFVRRHHIALSYENSRTANYDGDINVPMWIPYFGIQFTGTNYRATLIGSPFASVQLKMPLGSDRTEFRRISATGDIPSTHPWPLPWLRWVLDFQHSENEQTQLCYEFNKVGAFLEGDFEYDLRLTSRFALNLWARAQFLHFRGNGTAGWKFNDSVSNTFSTTGDLWFWTFKPRTAYILTNLWNFSATNAHSNASAGSTSGQGSLNIYTYALGVSASIDF